ncbi:CDP-alcohol phosphatidyltransferase family protein [Lyticum sinuosum]|uniref:CDP-alcohol phosphatidyltransferase n=1 Tax=Lyticum sinuosum TaxID=1332059 RepID=A0AAE4VM43_9RICK|nr:phosphatidylcholine/phosphatidylserine synthase [Lyticum sinuosum]MDZ5761139.1 CDP-alcohol phosphatidyltransferase [Lyticum sinuosum]
MKKRKKKYKGNMPLHKLFPSIITMMGLCSGVTAIKYAMDGQFSLAIAFIFYAALFDIIDGRIARILNVASEFGAQLDSLCDLVNFGVVPAIVIHSWCEKYITNISPIEKHALWIGVLVYVSCTAMRLARFNIQSSKIDFSSNNPITKIYQKLISEGKFFNGVPSTIGGLLVLFPIVVSFDIIPGYKFSIWIIMIYMISVALLMVSTIPTLSSKKLVIQRKNAPIIIVFILCFFVIVLLEPWILMPCMQVFYIITLPITYFKCKKIIKIENTKNIIDN